LADRSTQMVRMSTTPVNVPRTTRTHRLRTLTSLPAGKMVPIACSPILREDNIRRGQLRLSFEMYETVEVLLNGVNVNVMAYMVPWLAMERFESLNEFNKSYKGLPYKEGDAVIPFFETQAMPAHGASEFYTHLGLHARPGDTVNTMYLEAYNQIWNYRAKNRSPDITLRQRLDDTLADAFWLHEQYHNIVPDFDQAKIDGEVPLNVTNPDQLKIPIRGLGTAPASTWPLTNEAVRQYPGVDASFDVAMESDSAGRQLFVEQDPDRPGYPNIFADMSEELGISVSLSNIELARKTAAFATLRTRYNQLDDEYLIDMLMDGLSIPEESLNYPLLLGQQMTMFGQSKRYSSTAGQMTDSAVNGATFVDMTIRTPRINTGGVLMVVAEITPEQLFERNKDQFFHTSDPATLPEYLRDELDPEKVSVVPNEWVDIDHDTPDDTFGYAPLNHEWNIVAPKVGGRFYRPEVDEGFDEDRQRIWAVETQNPTLSNDFYVCRNMHTKPFIDQNNDPFECVLQGGLAIEGNTVFGRYLYEASDDYEKVLEKAPQDRIEKDNSAGPASDDDSE
jgi:hypothetical protein